MNNTSRMAAMLGAMHRERNGAYADALRFHGRAFGLNYGVSLATVRTIARAEAPDHGFARYLYLQDVRELRLAALHIAQPERLTADEFGAWAAGIINSEVAEEAAFAFFSRAECLPELFEEWIDDENYLLQYAAIMVAARCEKPSVEWVAPALVAVEYAADTEKAQLLAEGAVALLAAIGSRSEENRQAVLRAVGSRVGYPGREYIREELAWRLAQG